MSEIVKQEATKLVFSLVFLGVVIAIMFLIYPKILSHAGKKQATAFWKAEREANEERLFGGG